MEPTRLDRLFEMLKEEPRDSFLLYAIATEYLKLSNLPKALFYFQQVLETNPDYVGVYYHLGKLYELLSDAENAELTYQNGMLIARKMGDNHAYNELKGAFAIFKGLDDEDE